MHMPFRSHLKKALFVLGLTLVVATPPGARASDSIAPQEAAATSQETSTQNDSSAKKGQDSGNKKDKDSEKVAVGSDSVPRIETKLTVIAESAPRKAEVSPDVLSLPANTIVLTRLAFESKPYRETGEVLRALPGIDFVYYGQGGIPSGPSIRGYTDRNFGQDIAGHLDGIPLNVFGFVASHGALDLTMLVPETIERVEVVRGPMSARYGDFNRGASIDFVTRDGIEHPSLSLSGGSFGSVRAGGSYGNYDPKRTRPSFYANIEVNHTDGYARRQALDHWRGAAQLLIPWNKSDLKVSAQVFDSDWEAPSYIDQALVKSGALSDKDFINPTDGGSLTQKLGYLRYRRDPGKGSEFAATAYLSGRDWLRFRHDQLISPTQAQTKQVDDRTTWGFRAEKSFSRPLFGRPSLLLVGSQLQHDDAATTQDRTLLRQILGPTDDVGELLTQFAVYAQEQIGVTDRLKLVLGARYSRVGYDLADHIKARGTYVSSYKTEQWSPKLGIAWTPVHNLDVFANIATGMRSPTPRTEVRNSLDSVGRVEIAETKSYEAGIRARAVSRLDIQGSVWRADNSNEIRGIPPGGVQFESLGKSRRDGGEVELGISFGPTRIYGALSWVDAELLTPAIAGATHFPDVAPYVHQIGFETRIGVGGSRSGSLNIVGDFAIYGPKDLNTLGTIKSEEYERATARVTYAHKTRYRIWLGGVLYPGSRLGESAFLFGSKVGVRPNPRLSVEGGVAWKF